MSDFIDQFFGDAKQLRLSSQEKSAAWKHIGALTASKSIALSSMEKADSFAVIAKHMNKHPIALPSHSLSGFWRFHKMAASVMIAVLLIGAGGGTAAYAAEGAMPDDVLYPVKLHVNERIIEALQRTPEDRVDWEAKRIERRLREAEHIAKHKELLPLHQERMRNHIEERMNSLEEVLEHVPEQYRAHIAEQIDEQLERHETFLSEMEEEVQVEVHEFKQGIDKLHKKFRTKHGRPDGTLPPPPPPFRTSSTRSSVHAVSSSEVHISASGSSVQSSSLPQKKRIRPPKQLPLPAVQRRNVELPAQITPPPREEKEELKEEKEVIKQQNKDERKENAGRAKGIFRSQHPFFKVNASVHSRE